MDLDFHAGRGLTTGSRRRWAALIFAALIGALAMAIASPARAADVATAWGLNQFGQLGDGTSTGPEKCGSEVHACSTTPVGVSGLTGVKAEGGGSDHSLALLESHTVMS